jgi:hypothetical protein
VLELVIRQDRSYGELSELLGIPEREVRDRADAALRSLAGEPADRSVDTGRIADWLLGQQTERAARATADSVAASEPARAWASDVADRLREVGGEKVPAVPGAAEPPAAAPRPRPLRDGRPAATTAAAAAAPAPSSRAERGSSDRPAVPAPVASKTGGAVLIGVAVLVLVALLVWPVNLLGLGGDDETTPTASVGATPTPTATPGGSLASQATGNDIVLTGSGTTAQAEGLMRLFKSDKGAVQFAIGAQGVPNNGKGESYAVWFTRHGKPPKLLGFPQTQVTNGVLTVGGPTKADEKAFPTWFATYDKVLITRETTGKPKTPGPVVVQGTLPHGQGVN